MDMRLNDGNNNRRRVKMAENCRSDQLFTSDRTEISANVIRYRNTITMNSDKSLLVIIIKICEYFARNLVVDKKIFTTILF